MAADMDLELMLRVKAGDREAFAALYARRSRPVFRFLLTMTGRREAAEDCLQETFVRAWQAAPRWEPGAPVASWLFAIARNAWLTVREREQGRAAILARLGGLAGDPAPPPDEPLAARERAEAVRRAVDRLPEGERAVVALAVFENLRYAEVARILEIPEGTVKSRMFDALARLRTALGNAETDKEK